MTDLKDIEFLKSRVRAINANIRFKGWCSMKQAIELSTLTHQIEALESEE